MLKYSGHLASDRSRVNSARKGRRLYFHRCWVYLSAEPFVYQWPTLQQNVWTDLDKISRIARTWHTQQKLLFRWSGSPSGIGFYSCVCVCLCVCVCVCVRGWVGGGWGWVWVCVGVGCVGVGLGYVSNITKRMIRSYRKFEKSFIFEPWLD